jgi:response regulator RpfG family c-di-GMP phosphodiesterase
MDIKLRDEIDGIEVAERIHAASNIPVLFVSAYADNDTIQRATKSSNKINYIIKPFHNTELYNSIETILKKEQ